MQNISELNIPAAQPRRHGKTKSQTAPQNGGNSRRPESNGLSREELRKIVADLLG